MKVFFCIFVYVEKRWDDRSAYIDSFNKHWVRPADLETLKGKERVE